MRDQVEQCFAEEGKSPAELPLGVLRFVCVSDDQSVIDRYVNCARFQNRIAFTLENRRETMVDDYMVDEVPFPDEPPLDEIAKNIVAGNTEVVAERLCQEIDLYRPRHMCL